MGVSTIPAQGFLPGMVQAYAGSTVPAGWLLCNGAEISKITYAALWAAFGSAHVYGTPADPTNNFLVPNLKGKIVAMQDAGQTEFATLGLAGGSKTSTAPHTHGMSSHNHTGTANSGAPNDNTSDWPNDNTSDWPSDNTSDGGSGTTNWQSDNFGNYQHFHGAYIGSEQVGWTNNTSHVHYGIGALSERGSGGGAPGASPPVNVNTTDTNHWHGTSPHNHGMKNHTHGMKNHTHTMKNHIHATTLTTGAPSNNTSEASSAGATSGNLPPYLTMQYLIKT